MDDGDDFRIPLSSGRHTSPKRSRICRHDSVECHVCAKHFDKEVHLRHHTSACHGFRDGQGKHSSDFLDSDCEKNALSIPVSIACEEPNCQGDLYRTQPKPGKRSQTPGEIAPSESTALRIAQLSLGGNRDHTPSQRTSSRRKRAATSDIQPRADIFKDCAVALSTAQPDAKCVKRVACGESPFTHDFGKQIVREGAISDTHCATHVKEQASSAVLPSHKKRVGDQPVSGNRQVAGPIKSSTNSNNTDLGPLRNSLYPGIIRQPDSRPITSNQLETEVKSIYSKLVAVEAKCVSLDNAELASDKKHIDVSESDKWQAMMALHRTLLYEHHDFLSASQHPAAQEPLKRLALKHAMPARMWKHAIHSFLEVLRRRLPDSMDYMLQFIYTAYQMIALLYETVETFKPTWIECLGDLARYRMAIEDGVQRDRETWGVVARSWYSMASDMNPHIGRLYHHLGILARPNAVRQLYYYSRSLTCIEPFLNARESLSTLLISAFEAKTTGPPLPYVDDIDAMLLYLHSVMFMSVLNGGESNGMDHDFLEVQAEYVSRVDEQMNNFGAKWKSHGVFVAIANLTACIAYGYRESGSPLALAFDRVKGSSSELAPNQQDVGVWKGLLRAARVLFPVFTVVLRRTVDTRMLPHVHVVLVFIQSVARTAANAGSFAEMFLQLVPWIELVAFLNSFPMLKPISASALATTSPDNCLVGYEGDSGPLPEDYSLRGECWAQSYLPDDWFRNAPDEDTRYLEQPSTDKTRVQRVHWIGVCISKQLEYLDFDYSTMNFATSQGPSKLWATLQPRVQTINSQKLFHNEKWGG